jgi:HEAT repeat protein
LLHALDDPSPRVREYACVGLYDLGSSAEQAASKLISVLHDQDRFVRYMAARALGRVIGAGSARRAEAVRALTGALADKDPEVGLGAAETLLELGESQLAAQTIVAALAGTDSYRRDRARWILRSAPDPEPFIGAVGNELRNHDAVRRDAALQVLLQFASPEAVRASLSAVLDDGQPEVRRWAEAQLKRLTASP